MTDAQIRRLESESHLFKVLMKYRDNYEFNSRGEITLKEGVLENRLKALLPEMKKVKMG